MYQEPDIDHVSFHLTEISKKQDENATIIEEEESKS